MRSSSRFPFLLTMVLAGLLATACSPARPAAALAARDGGLPAAAQELVESALQHDVRFVVIEAPEDPDGRRTALGQRLADELAQAMVEVDRKLSICDRAATEAILREHRYQRNGMVDGPQRDRLGRFCGPDGLIHGTIVRDGRRLRVEVRLVTMDDALYVGSASWFAPADAPDREPLDRVPATGEGGADGGGMPEPDGSTRALRDVVELDAALDGLGRGDGPTPRYFELGREELSGPFRFELRRCIFGASDYLKCVLTVGNGEDRERTLRLRGHDVTLIDTGNAAYGVQLLSLGGDDWVPPRPGQVLSRPIPADEQIQLELIFTGVPRVKKKGQTLHLSLDDQSPVYFHSFFFARKPQR